MADARQMILQSILSGFQQPTANLQQTQAATGEAGAVAGQAAQNTVNAKLEQTLKQANVDQLKVINDAGDFFSKHTDSNGYIAPKYYNAALGSYVQKGGDAANFDNTYANRYVDPNNAFYDTPDAKAARASLASVKTVLHSYFNMGKLATSFGPELQGLGQIPVIGGYLQQRLTTPETAYGAILNGEVSKIRSIVDAGKGQGFRFNLQELNNISGNLPGPYDAKDVVNRKLDTLNELLKNSLGMQPIKQNGKTLEPVDQVLGGQ